MVFNIAFYLTGQNTTYQNRISEVIEEFLKGGIRCYVMTSRPWVKLNKYDPQFCIIRNDPLTRQVLAKFQKTDLSQEGEFLKKQQIRLILTDDPTIFTLMSPKVSLPIVKIQEMIDNFQSKKNLEIAGAVINHYLENHPRSERYAVFDVGTNNILLLWAILDKKRTTPLHRAAQISAMGKNMKDGKLTQAGIERTKKILRDFLGLTRNLTDNIIIVGTSCSRESDNISLLIDWLQGRYGLKYTILSEDVEASLVGLANRELFSEERELIIFDIGGGSTEFIYYQNGDLIFQTSLRLGIRRLESCYNRDSAKKVQFICEAISKIPADLLHKPVLVGVGGTVTNISAVKQGLKYYDSAAVHKSRLTKGDIRFYLEKFRKMSMEDIARLMPFEPLRANVITTGLLIVLEIMEYFRQEEIYVSDFGLQFGILEKIRKGHWFTS